MIFMNGWKELKFSEINFMKKSILKKLKKNVVGWLI